MSAVRARHDPPNNTPRKSTVSNGRTDSVGFRHGSGHSVGERAAAASFTAVPRSLAAALSPSLGGILFAAGWLAAPLVACGALKIAYDLALLMAFRRHHNEGRRSRYRSP